LDEHLKQLVEYVREECGTLQAKDFNQIIKNNDRQARDKEIIEWTKQVYEGFDLALWVTIVAKH
jgi:hypothetical protein